VFDCKWNSKKCKISISKWEERERLQTRGKVKDSTEARPVPEYSMLFDFLTPIPGISY
jgi:hypothetical protein